MADKPILFSGPMVRALLEGRKTQTRRVLKPQPAPRDFRNTRPETARWFHDPVRGGMWIADGAAVGPFRSFSPGDRLWVREAWRTTDSLDHLSPKQIAEACVEAGYRGPWCPYLTEADRQSRHWSDEDRGVPMFGGFSDKAGRFRQGMHMPRWASRLTLTITDVRVQRVQDISEADAIAEGCRPVTTPRQSGSARGSFAGLWDSLNDNPPKRPYGWQANPWVTALTFTVQRGNIDQLGGA